MDTRKLVLVFAVIKAIESAMHAWFFPIYAVFVLSKGLTLLELNLLNTLYMTTLSILDPITGVLGDRFGQKRVYLAGTFVYAVGMFAYGLGSGFATFAFAEFSSAVGSAFMSEALESGVRNQMQNEEAQKALASSGFWGKLAVIPTAILGGIVGEVLGLNVPWIMGGIFSIINFLVTAILLEDFRTGPKIAKAEGEDAITIRKTWKRVSKINSFQFAILVSFVSALCFQPFNMFWGPILESLGGKVWWFGFLWIGISLAEAVGTKLLGSEKTSGKMLGFIFLATAIPIFIVSLSNSLTVVVIGFLLHEVGRGGLNPVLFGLANKDNNDNASRTTANSIRSSARTFGAATGLLIFGALTEFVSPLQTWTISAVFVIVLAVICFRRKD